MSKENWDVHDHKDELSVSDFLTIFHPERGVLCQYVIHWNHIIYQPIKWESREKAYNWIREGTIAEIQESLSNLHICFSFKCFEPRNRDNG